jgi:fatty-acyl-CoA synthase
VIEFDWLSRWNLYTPKAVAFNDIENSRIFTYNHSFRAANKIASYLKNQGIEKGDKVSILSQNKIETVFLFFALQRLGAVLVPINFRLAEDEVKYIVEDSESKVIFYEEGLSAKLSRVGSEVKKLSVQRLEEQVYASSDYDEVFEFCGEETSPCQILYTSGTTGFPKGVLITNKILFWNSVNTSLSLNLTSNDAMVSFLPLFHTGGWNVLLTPFVHRGARTVFLSKFDAAKILEVCETEKITILFGVPTTLSMMTKDETFKTRDLSSLRFAVVGGEPMPLSMIKVWHERRVYIRQGFGLTECGPNCFSLNDSDAETKIGSIGRPNFYVQTKIVDEQNKDVPVGSVGELLLKGPMCMESYWKNEEATEKAFLDGWLRTGDLVKKDEDEYYYVVGRKKEMYISGGENVYPAEVEKVLSLHPAVDEVAVLGVQDETWGEAGKAYVVLKKNQSLEKEELTNYCLDKLAKFKIPKHITFMEELPKSDTGKILKKQLQV